MAEGEPLANGSAAGSAGVDSGSARPVVWVPAPIDDAVVRSLAGWADVRLGWGGSAASWADVAPQVQGVLLRTARVDGAMMREAPRLRIVARHGVGLDTVDVTTAAELGIEVTTTPAANSRSVAELAVALLMVTRRGLGPALAGAAAGTGSDAGSDAAASAGVRAGEGAAPAAAGRAAMTGRELSGATLGLLGYGRIAQLVAGIARDGLGMTVVAHDPHLSDEAIREAGAEPAGLDDLLRTSDALSVHVPLTDATRGLLSARELALLPTGAVVVNTSRGGVVDEEALVAALESGHLAGAGLDVTSVEPLPGDHPLRHRADVVLTPHVGGQTREAMSRVGHEAAAHLRRALLPRPTP